MSAYTTRRQLPLLLDAFDNIIRKHVLQNYLPQELNFQKALSTMLVTFSSLSWSFCPQNLSKRRENRAKKVKILIIFWTEATASL